MEPARREDGWTLRAGTADDAAAIATLIASYADDLVLDRVQAAPYFASVSEEAERGYLASPRYRYVVAEVARDAGIDERPHDGRRSLAGFVAMRDTTHLFHLFVERSWHRRGLARALWSHVRGGIDATASPRRHTVNSSLMAVPVYRAFGFAEIGPVMHAHGIAYVPMATVGVPATA